MEYGERGRKLTLGGNSGILAYAGILTNGTKGKFYFGHTIGSKNKNS